MSVFKQTLVNGGAGSYGNSMTISHDINKRPDSGKLLLVLKDTDDQITNELFNIFHDIHTSLYVIYLPMKGRYPCTQLLDSNAINNINLYIKNDYVIVGLYTECSIDYNYYRTLLHALTIDILYLYVGDAGLVEFAHPLISKPVPHSILKNRNMCVFPTDPHTLKFAIINSNSGTICIETGCYRASGSQQTSVDESYNIVDDEYDCSGDESEASFDYASDASEASEASDAGEDSDASDASEASDDSEASDISKVGRRRHTISHLTYVKTAHERKMSSITKQTKNKFSYKSIADGSVDSGGKSSRISPNNLSAYFSNASAMAAETLTLVSDALHDPAFHYITQLRYTITNQPVTKFINSKLSFSVNYGVGNIVFMIGSNDRGRFQLLRFVIRDNIEVQRIVIDSVTGECEITILYDFAKSVFDFEILYITEDLWYLRVKSCAVWWSTPIRANFSPCILMGCPVSYAADVLCISHVCSATIWSLPVVLPRMIVDNSALGMLYSTHLKGDTNKPEIMPISVFTTAISNVRPDLYYDSNVIGSTGPAKRICAMHGLNYSVIILVNTKLKVKFTISNTRNQIIFAVNFNDRSLIVSQAYSKESDERIYNTRSDYKRIILTRNQSSMRLFVSDVSGSDYDSDTCENGDRITTKTVSFKTMDIDTINMADRIVNIKLNPNDSSMETLSVYVDGHGKISTTNGNIIVGGIQCVDDTKPNAMAILDAIDEKIMMMFNASSTYAKFETSLLRRSVKEFSSYSLKYTLG